MNKTDAVSSVPSHLPASAAASSEPHSIDRSITSKSLQILSSLKEAGYQTWVKWSWPVNYAIDTSYHAGQFLFHTFQTLTPDQRNLVFAGFKFSKDAVVLSFEYFLDWQLAKNTDHAPPNLNLNEFKKHVGLLYLPWSSWKTSYLIPQEQDALIRRFDYTKEIAATASYILQSGEVLLDEFGFEEAHHLRQMKILLRLASLIDVCKSVYETSKTFNLKHLIGRSLSPTSWPKKEERDQVRGALQPLRNTVRLSQQFLAPTHDQSIQRVQQAMGKVEEIFEGTQETLTQSAVKEVEYLRERLNVKALHQICEAIAQTTRFVGNAIYTYTHLSGQETEEADRMALTFLILGYAIGLMRLMMLSEKRL